MLRGNPGYRRKRGERGVAGIKMPCRNNAKNESIAGTGAARERSLVAYSWFRSWCLRGPFWRCCSAGLRRVLRDLGNDRANRSSQLNMITEAVRGLLGVCSATVTLFAQRKECSFQRVTFYL